MPTFYANVDHYNVDVYVDLEDVEVDLEIDDIVERCDTNELLNEIDATNRQTLLDWMNENHPCRNAPALTDEQAAAVKQAAFILETFAHLRGMETALLPTAETLRSITQPNTEA
jgi:hypothetical protein